MRPILSSLMALSAALLVACRADAADADAIGQPLRPTPGYATGTVTLEGGKPLGGDIRDILVTIEGVSEAGQRVSFTPVVKNGQFRQKLVPGSYRFGMATVKFHFHDQDFVLPLSPVESNWSKSQESGPGIVQRFELKLTGPTKPAGEADPNNATHWYGMSVGMRFATYREDKKASAKAPPTGTKLRFTLTPVSKSIDGRELQPVVIEREFRADRSYTNDDLNDFPLADWEITGVATLPGGQTQRIVFQGAGNYPNFVTTGKVPLQVDALLGGVSKQLFSWGLE